MLTRALALALALLACPPDVDPAACAEQAACVSRVYRARTASTGVTTTEAALVSRLDAEHACALVAWSRVRSSSAALALVRSVPPLVPAPAVCPEAPACEWPIAALLSAGSCALCGGAAAAVCGVAR